MKKKPKMDIEAMIRPSCTGFMPYSAGKPIETIKRELGLKRVVKLASNENPLGPSPRAVEAVRHSAERSYFYPDSNSWDLKQTISRKFRVAPERIVLGAGSDEIIELLAKAFFNPADEIVVSEHAFIRYKMAGDLMGCSVVSVPMKGFTHDLKAMAAAVTPKTKAVFVTNPNNPTGTYNTDAELRRFLSGVRKSAGGALPLVVLDEAYYEYARTEEGYPESFAYLDRYPNLVILRTFSKIYGLAGLRVGYGFASPEVVDYLDRIRPPFNVSLPAQAAAAASLGDRSQVTRSVALNRQQKKYLYREFVRMGLEFVPSAGNFVLVDVSPVTGKDLFGRLLREGVIVRAMDEYRYPNHVRVSIGLPEENRLLVDALKKVLKEETVPSKKRRS